MKKLSVVLALVLVVALAVPTFANPFTDVPADHWAYEAINKLVAAGIIEGYPDGTFKGQRELTRYEIAVMVSRLLNDLEEERAELAEELENAQEGLNTAQAQDVTAIVKALIEKNMPEPQKVELPEGLTDEQAEEVASLIEALTFEYKAELKVLGQKLDVVTGDIEDMDAYVAEMEARIEALENAEPVVAWSGEYGVDFKETNIDGTGTPYVDPYDKDTDDDDAEDTYSNEDHFKQTLDMNVAVNKGVLSADLDLSAYTDVFDSDEDTDGFALESLSGTISGPVFEASIAEGQEVEMRPYLFSGDDAVVNGVVLDMMGNTYYLSKNGKPVVAADVALDLLGQDLNVVAGMEGTDKKLAGVYTTLNFAGFEVKPEFAVSDKKLEERYFTLDVSRALGPLALEFNLTKVDGLQEIVAGETDKDGYKVKATSEGLMSLVDVSALYENYDKDPYTELTANLVEGTTFAGFGVTADWAYKKYTEVPEAATDDTATSHTFSTELSRTMGMLEVKTGLNYDDTSNGFAVKVEDAALEANDVDWNSSASAKLLGDALTLGAEYTYAIKDLEDNTGLTVHKYTADFVKGMLSAGVEMDVISKVNTVYAGLDPEAKSVFGVSLDPYFNYETKLADPSTRNIEASVAAEKALTERATLTGKYLWADKEHGADLFGTKVQKEVGFEYKLTEDVSATANYVDLDFEGEDADGNDASYNVKEATAGVSVAF